MTLGGRVAIRDHVSIGSKVYLFKLDLVFTTKAPNRSICFLYAFTDKYVLDYGV